MNRLTSLIATIQQSFETHYKNEDQLYFTVSRNPYPRGSLDLISGKTPWVTLFFFFYLALWPRGTQLPSRHTIPLHNFLGDLRVFLPVSIPVYSLIFVLLDSSGRHLPQRLLFPAHPGTFLSVTSFSGLRMRRGHAAPGTRPFPIFRTGAGGDQFPAFWNPPPEALPVSTLRWANVCSSTFPYYVDF